VLFCFSAVTGKDGSPTGVVWRGEAPITCSVKRNRSKSHIILTTPPNLPCSNNNFSPQPSESTSDGRASTTLSLLCHHDRSNSFFPYRTSKTEYLFLLCSRFASTRTDTPLNTCGHGSDPETSACPRQHLLAAARPRFCLLSRQSQHSRTPRHRHQLGYPIPHHGTCYLTLPRRSHALACAPTPHHGCMPRRQHWLCHPVLRYGTYLTLPRRSHAPAFAATPPLQRPRALAFAAKHILGGLPLRRSLPQTFSAGLHSGIHCHSTYSAGSRFGVCCHSTSPMAATSVPFKLNHATTDFNECTLFSLLRRVWSVFRFPWCIYFFWQTGKMGAPWGWYSVEEHTKPVVLKCIRS